MALQLDLAKKLRKFRERKGLTQVQMAEQFMMPLGTYVQAETNASMGRETMRKILNGMNEEKP
jgi:transcriptional regulator with XRE-family HTH domain